MDKYKGQRENVGLEDGQRRNNVHLIGISEGEKQDIG